MKAMSGYRHWTAREMMLLQRALTAQGFPVKADGKWGKETRVALKNFQKKNGLKPTGYPNRATVKTRTYVNEVTALCRRLPVSADTLLSG